MASKIILTKGSFLNSLIFSGILFANTINPYKINAGTLEKMEIPKFSLSDQHHAIVAKNG